MFPHASVSELLYSYYLAQRYRLLATVAGLLPAGEAGHPQQPVDHPSFYAGAAGYLPAAPGQDVPLRRHRFEVMPPSLTSLRPIYHACFRF